MYVYNQLQYGTDTNMNMYICRAAKRAWRDFLGPRVQKKNQTQQQPVQEIEPEGLDPEPELEDQIQLDQQVPVAPVAPE